MRGIHTLRLKESVEYKFSKEFYEEIDKRFFNNTKKYLRDKSDLPFSELIDFDKLPTRL